MRVILTSFVAMSLLLGACDSSSDTEMEGASEPASCEHDPVRDALESDCFDTCDDVWVVDCITNDGHDACWEACHDAPDEDLEAFSACIDDTLPMCSPDCVEDLTASAGVELPDDGETPG